MPIAFKCACGKAYKVPDEAAGRKLKCKECGEPLQVPKKAAKKKPQAAGDPNDIFSMDLGLEEDATPSGLPPRRKKSSDGGKKKKGKKNSAPPPSPKTGLYIGIGVLAVLVIGVGGFFIYQSMNGSGGSSAPEPMVVEYEELKYPNGGFSVKYPKGWEVDANVDKGGSGGIPPFANFDDGTAHISIKHNNEGAAISDMASIPGGGQIIPGEQIEEDPPAKSVHEFMGETVYSLNFKKFEEQPGKELKLPYGTGWLSTFTGKEGFGGTQKAYRLTLTGTRFQYNVICKCPEKKWEQYEPVFMEVIKSISQ
ncbi:MAG: hypothetical protein HON04_10320 [Planctomicrobium sp.]|jgi:hypothetical protein|nr:hypothetical protein [Planctomicrobium sp.]